MSQDIATFIQKLHLTQKPFIVGHSMGGKVLMALLLQNPEVACPTPYSLGPAPGTIHQKAQQESHLPLVGI